MATPQEIVDRLDKVIGDLRKIGDDARDIGYPGTPDRVDNLVDEIEDIKKDINP